MNILANFHNSKHPLFNLVEHNENEHQVDSKQLQQQVYELCGLKSSIHATVNYLPDSISYAEDAVASAKIIARIVFTAFKKHEVNELDSPEGQRVIAQLIRSDKRVSKTEALRAILARIIGKISFRDAMAQRVITGAIDDGVFGADQLVITELTTSVAKITFTDSRAKLHIIRALKNYKLNPEQNRFPEVNLRGEHLCGLNLRGLDLSGIDMSGADLRGTDLRGADLSYAILGNAILSGAQLQDTWLMYACLKDAKLKLANLSGANLAFANFERADLSGSNLTSANLMCVNLKAAILKRTNLSSADLNNVNLSGADLTEANMQNTNLIESRLDGAILDRTQLDQIYLSGTNLGGCIINSTLDIQLRFSEERGLDEDNLTDADLAALLSPNFNHLDYDATILTAINSLNPEYKELKILLMHQAIVFLKSKNITSVLPSLADILFTNPIYNENYSIRKFASNVVLDAFMHNADTKIMSFSHINSAILTDILLEKNDKQLTALVSKHNIGFNQIINQMLSANSSDLIKLTTLRTRYKQLMNFYQYEYESDEDPLIYLLNTAKDKQLILRQIDFNEMLTNPAIWQPGNIIYYADYANDLASKAAQPNELSNLSEIYNCQFPLLHAQYNCQQSIVGLGTHLNILFGAHKYNKVFQNAINNTMWRGEKLTSITHQEELAKIFNSVLNSSLHADERHIQVTDEHLIQIFAAYGYLAVSSQEKAKLLFTLSILFTIYASARYFGESTDSPEVLRRYALALLNTAAHHNGDAFEPAQLLYWRNMLLGMTSKSACASTLVANMCANSSNFLIRSLIPKAMNY